MVSTGSFTILAIKVPPRSVICSGITAEQCHQVVTHFLAFNRSKLIQPDEKITSSLELPMFSVEPTPNAPGSIHLCPA